jgi:Ala-tRNA(Pro) deacylase
MAAVLEYLQGRGQVFTVIPHPRAPISQDRVHPARIPRELLVKTVVAYAELAPVMLVVPASRTVDLGLVAEAVGDPRTRLATEEELERQFPDYEVGALPPLSMLLLAPTFVDPAVLERREIVFAAGRSDVSIRMSTRDLFGSDPVVVAPLTTESRVAATT